MSSSSAKPARLDLYHRSTKDALHTDSALPLLDAYERSRYLRYKVEPARHTFLLARQMIKTELGRRLGIAPKDVRFEYNKNGKPQLVSELSKPGLHFSLAHSQHDVLVGIADVDCGVDIEEFERLAKVSDDTASFVGDNAAKQIHQMAATPEQYQCYFAMFWTSMESIVKLRGSTLYAEQAIFDLVLNRDTYQFPQAGYTIASFDLSHAVASIAVANEKTDMALWHWQPHGVHREKEKNVLAATATFISCSFK